ncbi:MAG: hypothetical protein E7192_06700 [Erysipelotrichaceae bacterium]|nr:hypothetical protein [Erysipelotrichaceae bacterium]
MKHRLLPYYFLCVGVYVGLFLFELAIVHFFVQIFTTNTLVSVTVALPVLLFINPLCTWAAVELLIKK